MITSALNINVLMHHSREAGPILRMIMGLSLLPAAAIKSTFHDILLEINRIHDTTLRRLLRTFHRGYVWNFWISKIGPDRMSVFGLPHKSNNACEVI